MPFTKKVKTSAYLRVLRLYLLALFVLSFFIFTGYAAYTYNAVRNLIGVGGIIHNFGQFYSNNGNPWIVNFWAKPIETVYSGWHLLITESGQVLTGSFWVETIWWVNLDNIEFYLSNTGAGIWSLSGYAWSETAWWVDFSSATYQLSNTSFSGYAWNDMIWWIDMAGASLDITSSGAIGKVKILWSYGGNRIYDTVYTLDNKIAPATVTRIINDVRKNVWLLRRNLPANLTNTNIVSWVFDHGDIGWLKQLDNKLFFINESTNLARVDYTKSIQARFVNIGNAGTPVQSAIVIGADVYIDNSVLPQEDGNPRAIIAIKNEAWVGGNIIIGGWITRIKSTLLAEWSLYSWDYPGWVLNTYNDTPSDLFKIPNRQLYVKWTIISNNTIWGYGVDNGVAHTCPYNISPCNLRKALLYDFNHFRDFQKNLPEWQLAVIRWYTSNIYDDYSMVIEHDTRILDSPPPWFESIK